MEKSMKLLTVIWMSLLLLASKGLCKSEQAKVDPAMCASFPDPVFLKPGTLPTTALASFQGSGNTWVRQVLARATGYKTGDLYKSYGDDAFPEFSSSSNDTAVAIKTHTFSADMTREYAFERALLIVRHPLDALYSEFNRMFGGNKTVYAEAKHLINPDGSLSWKWDVWMSHISSWVDFHRYWLHWFEGPTHIVYYNNLKHKPHSELLAAVNFLTSKADMTRVNCTVEYPRPAYFKRPNIEPPVAKSKLFKLSMSKARKAVHILKKLVRKRFGEESQVYREFNLDISVPDLQ